MRPYLGDVTLECFFDRLFVSLLIDQIDDMQSTVAR